MRLCARPASSSSRWRPCCAAGGPSSSRPWPPSTSSSPRRSVAARRRPPPGARRGDRRRRAAGREGGAPARAGRRRPDVACRLARDGPGGALRAAPEVPAGPARRCWTGSPHASRGQSARGLGQRPVPGEVPVRPGHVARRRRDRRPGRRLRGGAGPARGHPLRPQRAGALAGLRIPLRGVDPLREGPCALDVLVES